MLRYIFRHQSNLNSLINWGLRVNYLPLVRLELFLGLLVLTTTVWLVVASVLCIWEMSVMLSRYHILCVYFFIVYLFRNILVCRANMMHSYVKSFFCLTLSTVNIWHRAALQSERQPDQNHPHPCPHPLLSKLRGVLARKTLEDLDSAETHSSWVDLRILNQHWLNISQKYMN